jgi:hypothetical protein
VRSALHFVDEDSADVSNEDDVGLKGFKVEFTSRCRVARADSSVVRIKRKIETVFVCPRGPSSCVDQWKAVTVRRKNCHAVSALGTMTDQL